MTFPLSRAMSTATAVYGVYALVRPRHLGRLLTGNHREQETYDVLARTYGVRDLTISAIGGLGRSSKTVGAAMLMRIVMDLGDGTLLSVKAEDKDGRMKLLGATFTWAALNAVAWTVDRRRA
jgi:hypothetical protein